MFDPKKLLDSLLGAGGASGGDWSRTGSAAGQGGPGASGGSFLGDIASSLSTPDGIRQKANQAVDYARQNPLAAGALLAGVLGTGFGRGLAGSALKYGGLAAIASMAYKAYQDHQAGQQPARGAQMPELQPVPADTGFAAAEAPQGEDAFALALIRAMIAAAKADGTIDEEERKRIGDKVKLGGLEGDAEQFLMEELAKPVDVDAIVAQAKTEAQRVELYTASRLAINPDSRAERGYLDLLAGRLGLPDSLIEHIEGTVSSVQAA